ncbi:MAG TPA: acyl-protein synthetase, partial [Polyangiaceae bacterium]|nr:acyl-protein synthetase [Polyangiaceae bacterium]
RLERAMDIPAVPVEAFRHTRIAVHPEAHDQVRFLTSGTTSGARGMHCMRRTDTYRMAALAWGSRALVPVSAGDLSVICLATEPELSPSSSLGFMMRAFLESFDSTSARATSPRWLLNESGVDLPAMQCALDQAAALRRPVLLLATSFALVYLLEALCGAKMRFDGQLIVMQTGGYKGKTREVSPEELAREITSTFPEAAVDLAGEYGMTELSSQLYEGKIPGAALATPPGWYAPPPWLRVRAVEPTSFREVPDGEVGLACFTDLANVDSALRVLTNDQVVCRGELVRLLGRAPTSAPRGCSLSAEELLGGSS